MDLFMPAERVLYDRAYYLSDEAERDYAFEVAEEHGIDVGEVLYSDELMKEVRDALDRDIDLYTPQDCFGFSEPFAGRIEYSEKKPKIAAKAKPDPADLGRRASVAAGATIRDGVDGGGIKL